MKPSRHLDVLFERCPGQRDRQRCLRVLLRYMYTVLHVHVFWQPGTNVLVVLYIIIFYFSFSARLALQLLRRLQCRNSSWLLHLLFKHNMLVYTLMHRFPVGSHFVIALINKHAVRIMIVSIEETLSSYHPATGKILHWIDHKQVIIVIEIRGWQW